MKWTRKRIRRFFKLIVSDREFVRRFAQYHYENPHVFAEFLRRAQRIQNTGRERYSQRTIIEAMRWSYDIATRGDVFKINNDFIALYARMAIETHPPLKGLFELRKMKKGKRHESEEERMRRGNGEEDV